MVPPVVAPTNGVFFATASSIAGKAGGSQPSSPLANDGVGGSRSDYRSFDSPAAPNVALSAAERHSRADGDSSGSDGSDRDSDGGDRFDGSGRPGLTDARSGLTDAPRLHGGPVLADAEVQCDGPHPLLCDPPRAQQYWNVEKERMTVEMQALRATIIQVPAGGGWVTRMFVAWVT